jgi:hypothetical protein
VGTGSAAAESTKLTCVSLTAKKDALVGGGKPDQGELPGMTVDLLVDGAKILVVRLREIGRGGRQSKWVYGNGGSFANGRFN